MLGVRLDAQLEQRLNDLAKKSNRSKSYIAKEALIRFIAMEEAKEREKTEALARWEAYQVTGEVVSNEAMTDWLDSWGADKEKSCPAK